MRSHAKYNELGREECPVPVNRSQIVSKDTVVERVQEEEESRQNHEQNDSPRAERPQFIRMFLAGGEKLSQQYENERIR